MADCCRSGVGAPSIVDSPPTECHHNGMTQDEIIAVGRTRMRFIEELEFARALRRMMGLTLNEMGLLLQASRTAVYRWEEGSRIPRPRVLLRYAKIVERMEESRDS